MLQSSDINLLKRVDIGPLDIQTGFVICNVLRVLGDLLSDMKSVVSNPRESTKDRDNQLPHRDRALVPLFGVEIHSCHFAPKGFGGWSHQLASGLGGVLGKEPGRSVPIGGPEAPLVGGVGTPAAPHGLVC